MTKRHLRLMKAATRPGLSKDRITTAALRLIDRDGLEGLTMRGLAKELEVDPMAVYRHYSGKDELVDAVRAAALTNWEATFLAGPAAAPSGRERLISLGLDYIGLAETKPAQFTLLFDSLPLSYRNWEELAKQSWIYTTLLEEMRAAARESEAEAHPSLGMEEAAYAFWAFIHGLSILALMKEARTAGVDQDLHRPMIEGFLGRSQASQA